MKPKTWAILIALVLAVIGCTAHVKIRVEVEKDVSIEPKP